MKSHALPARAAAASVIVVTALSAPRARAVLLDSGTYDQKPNPPKPVVTCSLSDAGITVTSFADILGYQLKGTCTVVVPGNPAATKTSPYEGGGSWNSATGQVNEFLKGKDGKGVPWDIQDGGTCKLNPWMTGRAAASCSGNVGSASPNAPTAFVKALGVPLSPDLLDAQARGSLTGKTLAAMKAEHQAPVIVKPTAGPHATPLPVLLQIDAGPGSPTKSFALEWEAKVGNAWTKKTVLDQSGPSASIAGDKFQGLGEWRLRARAHQSANAQWSAWQSFLLPVVAEPPCANSAVWGATYDVTFMKATIQVGALGTTTIKVTNASNQIWPAGSNYHLAYHWVLNGQMVVPDGERTTLPSTVLPCKAIVLNANVKGPPSEGTWTIQWDMVLDGVSWFSNQGVPVGTKTVTASIAPPPPPQPAKK